MFLIFFNLIILQKILNFFIVFEFIIINLCWHITIFIIPNFMPINPISIFMINLINFFYLFTYFLKLIYFLITLNLD